VNADPDLRCLRMRILIADDDPLSTDLLARHVHKLDPDAVVEAASSGIEAMERLKRGRPDLLMLDLNMPGMDGRDLLGVVGASVPVIITSGDRDFAAEAFRHEVVDYLVKPVLFERFAQAWRKFVLAHAAGADGQLEAQAIVFVREGTDMVRLDLREVRCIKSESNYVRFVLEGRSVTSLMNLKDLEVRLPPSFVRVHRSYIVNLRHVERLDTLDVKIGADLIPVSDGYRAELIKRLDLL
jgi:DNA-binding LytR/AlgR family response regulator